MLIEDHQDQNLVTNCQSVLVAQFKRLRDPHGLKPILQGLIMKRLMPMLAVLLTSIEPGAKDIVRPWFFCKLWINQEDLLL
jgi:hypothetical protein